LAAVVTVAWCFAALHYLMLDSTICNLWLAYAAGTWGVDLRWGGSMSSSLSRFSGWRSRYLSLGEGLPDSTGAGMAPALMGCWIEGGAGFFLFSVIACRRRRATGSIATGTWGVDLRWGLSAARSLSDISGWRAGVLYPLAVGGRESARRIKQ
jgi:hypothetical protein